MLTRRVNIYFPKNVLAFAKTEELAFRQLHDFSSNQPLVDFNDFIALR
jgi:hypothetical protein